MSRGPEPAGRSGIGSSNSRFQPRSVTGLDRGETDGLSIRTALGEHRYDQLKPYVDAVLAGRHQVFEIGFAAAGAELARGTYIPHRDEQGRVIGFSYGMSSVALRAEASFPEGEPATLLIDEAQRGQPAAPF